MPSPGDVVPYPPYPAAGAAAEGGLQYSLEATQVLVKAVLDSILARLPSALAADQSLKVTLQNSIVAAISGNVAVTNMIPAVETGLAKEATQLLVRGDTARLDIALSALRDALKGGKTLGDIWTSLQLQKELAESIWTDNSGAYFVRRVVIDESAGTFTVSWTDADGNAAAGPGAGKRPLSSPDREVVQSLFSATANGAGYSTGDILARCLIIDTSVVPPITNSTLWFNVTLGTSISTPGAGTYRQDLGVTDQELRASPLGISAAQLPASLKDGRMQVDAHVLARYRVADEAVGGVGYTGFLAANGDWYIMKNDSASGTYRYANPSNNQTITGGYSGAGADKAWVNRATLTYGYLNQLSGL